MCRNAFTTSVSPLPFSEIGGEVEGAAIGEKGLGSTGVCEQNLIYHSNLRR
jgi:hypothetical protein